MVDERQRVIRDLLLRLSESGVDPAGPFSATFIPGQGWTFAQEPRGEAGSSSSSPQREVNDDEIPKGTVQAQRR